MVNENRANENSAAKTFQSQFIAEPVPYGNTVMFDREHRLVFRFSEKSLPLLFEWATGLAQRLGKQIVDVQQAKLQAIEERERLPPTHKQVLQREVAGYQASIRELEKQLEGANPVIRAAVEDAIRNLKESLEPEILEDIEKEMAEDSVEESDEPTQPQVITV